MEFNNSYKPSPFLRKKLKIVLQNSSLQTPCICCSSELLKFNTEYFQKHLTADKIFFPVKVNHDPQVLRTLSQNGLSFEIASQGELELLQKNRLHKKEIIFSNPVRIQKHTKAAFDSGVRTFAVDRLSELKRLAKNAPGSKVYIRLSVSNTGAAWPLDTKFGVDAQEAIKLMTVAKELNHEPRGVAFHVGWCNSNISTWKNSVEHAINVAGRAIKKSFSIEFINIGGGFPAHNADQYTAFKGISSSISPLLEDARKHLGIQIWAEPGSFICANSSVLVTRVIDVLKKSGKNWVGVDVSVFQGFYWKLGGLKYKVISARSAHDKMKRWVVTGPTCDSQDIFTQAALLPADLKEGDFLFVFPAGAYINSAKEYNGIGYPGNLML